jgi:hypothetical protein
LLEEVLATVSFPVSAPVAVGSNCKFKVADCPGFRVTGNVTPDSVNPLPDTAALLTVTAAVPAEVRVSDCVDGTPTATLPKATLEELMVSVGPVGPVATSGFSLTVNVWLPPFAVEVRVTDSAAVTAVAVAVKLAVFEPNATVTVAGTATAALLLERFTVTAADAGEVRVTEQESVAAPVIELFVQVKAPTADAAFEFGTTPPQPASVMQLPRATKPNRKNED